MSKEYKPLYNHFNGLSNRQYKGAWYCYLLDKYVRDNKIRAGKGKKHSWMTQNALYDMLPQLITASLPSSFFVEIMASYCNTLAGPCYTCQQKKLIHYSIVKKLAKLHNFS